tara:strand:+ start:6114 stop:6284 length:171 start_codon:yes stop_codon:yes gene_type:complete
MNTPDLCIEVGEISKCMDGDVLIAAILLECTLYFILFVTGFKLVEWLKKEWRKSRK